MKKRRILLVQYGDYAEALKARDEGREENYRAQFYSLDAVDELVQDGECCVICLDAGPYKVLHGSYTVYAGHYEPQTHGRQYHKDAEIAAERLFDVAKSFEPTHAILRAPGWVLTRLGRKLVEHGVPVLPLLADYFPHGGLKNWLRNKSVVSLLNDERIVLCSNHNRPACRSMKAAGITPEKIVPWDWPASHSPEDSPPKELTHQHPVVFYAGMMLTEKGVPELLHAVVLLHERGIPVRAVLCGVGPDEKQFMDLAQELGCADSVDFLGQTANSTVLQKMHEAQLVVVPSRHEYPEGLPSVIYEAFETRTPAVLSDHPTFVESLRDGEGCRFFTAGDESSCADCIQESLQDAAAYAVLSETTEAAWKRIRCPVAFREVLLDWANAVEHGTAPRLLEQSLAAEEGA